MLGENQEPLINMETLPVLTAALKIFTDIFETYDENSNPYLTNITLNSGDVIDIIELLIFFVEKYEIKVIEDFIGKAQNNDNILNYLSTKGKPN